VHDAGYDAYMTGVVFATISKFIEIDKIFNKINEKYDNLKKKE
jgi:hypothetical protein